MSGTRAKTGVQFIPPDDHNPQEIILWSLKYMIKVTDVSSSDQDQGILHINFLFEINYIFP